MIPPSRVAAGALVPFAVLIAAAASGCHSAEIGAQQPALHATASIASPPVGAPKPVDMPGLHNVVTYAPAMFGGSQPEGAEGLETLAAMGIKTIVTVDGAKPDVEGAQRLGMRYVHLPISYDTVTPARQHQLAQAIASCEGPIYLHCHHGKHRSAAALGSALVVSGALTPDRAAERMAVSGCAKDYTGLWQAVAAAEPAPREQLLVDPATFPSVATVTGMVATMAEIDQVFDLVKQAQKAGWKPPQDHPDLVPTKETARMASLFANLLDDAESRALPADYQAMLTKSIGQSRALDAAVRAGDIGQAEELLANVGKSCKTCHVVHRDK